MKEIELTQGKVTIVDDENYEWLSQYKWHAMKNKKRWYAVRRGHEGEPKTVSMGRFILGLGKEELCDHINRDGLDNRRVNLRCANITENNRNRGKRKHNTSGYKGVRREWNKWKAEIRVGGKHIFIGMFNTPEEAADAYDEAVVKYHGEFATTNKILSKARGE